MNIIIKAAMAVFLLSGFMTTSTAYALENWPRVTGVNGSLASYRIVYVTSLADSGPGSLRDVIQSNYDKGPVIVRFKVKGVIPLKSKVPVRNKVGIVIDGAAAPNGGITLENNGLSIRTSNVMVKDLRIHVGNRKEGGAGDDRDGIQILGDNRETVQIRNILIRNNSVIWAADESASIVSDNASDIVFENNLFAEPMRNSGVHPKNNHNLNFMVGRGATRVRIMNNIFAGGNFRNPQIGEGADVIVANNIIYNPGIHAIHYTGQKLTKFDNDPLTADTVSNIIIAGPDTVESTVQMGKEKVKTLFPYPVIKDVALPAGSKIFHSGNFTILKDGTVQPWYVDASFIAKTNPNVAMVTQPNFITKSMGIQSDMTAITNMVMDNAGAWARKKMRDSTDKRILAEIAAKTNKFIDTPPSSEFKK